ncbi:hypothetical protein [Salinisphaera sp.]|uniref:carboxypeptidase-like regulatory domain-containing protein n=1 Tax=Salinisphaera sp. TaxID=1914330 RepID=UPI002D78FDDA|nr:hypothetical protein [Salinisphaera sp.]
MGTRKRQILRLALAAALAAITLQGCVSAGKNVHGRVIDADTGQPVQGAYVYARSGYYECGLMQESCGCVNVDAALTRTDKKGYYRFDKEFYFGGSFFSDKFGTIVVYKKGYESVDNNYGLNSTYNKQDLYAEFFFGNGRYLDDYNKFSIKSNSGIYNITKHPIEVEVANSTSKIAPRLRYLVTLPGATGPPGCIDSNGEVKKVFDKFKNIIVNDALEQAKTPEEKEIVKENLSI